MGKTLQENTTERTREQKTGRITQVQSPVWAATFFLPGLLLQASERVGSFDTVSFSKEKGNCLSQELKVWMNTMQMRVRRRFSLRCCSKIDASNRAVAICMFLDTRIRWFAFKALLCFWIRENSTKIWFMIPEHKATQNRWKGDACVISHFSVWWELCGNRHGNCIQYAAPTSLRGWSLLRQNLSWRWRSR